MPCSVALPQETIQILIFFNWSPTLAQFPWLRRSFPFVGQLQSSDKIVLSSCWCFLRLRYKKRDKSINTFSVQNVFLPTPPYAHLSWVSFEELYWETYFLSNNKIIIFLRNNPLPSVPCTYISFCLLFVPWRHLCRLALRCPNLNHSNMEISGNQS